MVKTGLMKTTVVSRADTSQLTTANGFVVPVSEPEGTAVRYLVKTGSTWKKYDTATAAWIDATTQALTSTSVLSEGNKASELTAVPSAKMTAFVNTNVDWAIGFSMNETATTPPSAEPPQVAGKTGSEVHEQTFVSDSIGLSDTNEAVEILSVKINKTELAGGTVTVNGSIQGENGSWSAWQEINSYVTTPATKAKAIKLQTIAYAATIGTSEANLATVEIKHRTDNVAVFAEGNGYCVTKTLTLTREMSRAHLMVKRPVVQDTEIKAYLSLRAKPVEVLQEVLGVGDGAQHTYVLKNTNKIAGHTFKLYFDGTQQKAGFAFSSTDGKVTCTPPTGKSATVDYAYNWEKETFVPMVYDAQYEDTLNTDLVNDQFNYVATNAEDPRGEVASIKMELVQGKGDVEDEDVGTGNGYLQSAILRHKAKAETLVIKVDGVPVTNFTYKEATRTLFVTAAAGKKITASYSWVADPVYIDNFTSIWNE